MATESSQLHLIIDGNAEGASKALSEVGKSINTLAETLSKVSSTFSELGKRVSQSVQEAVKASSDISSMNKNFNSVGKSAGDVTKAVQSVAKAVQEQTRQMGVDFESLNKTTTDSSIGIVSEIDKVDRSVKAMGTEFTAVARDIEKSVNASNSALAKLTKKVESIGTTSEKSGKKVSKAIDFAALQMGGQQLYDFGLNIVKFFGASVKAGAEFSQTMANTHAALDSQAGAVKTTNQQMQEMQDLALKIGSTGFYSANQVGEAMSTLAKNGLKFNQITQGAIQATANVAAANQQDIDQTATLISDTWNELGQNIMNQFHGNITKGYQYVGDVITRVLHSSKISANDLFTTLRYVGASASNAKVPFSDLGAMIALLGSHAIRSSQAKNQLAHYGVIRNEKLGEFRGNRNVETTAILSQAA